MAVILNEQAVDYTNRRFSSGKTPNSQLFGHIYRQAHIHKLTRDQMHNPAAHMRTQGKLTTCRSMIHLAHTLLASFPGLIFYIILCHEVKIRPRDETNKLQALITTLYTRLCISSCNTSLLNKVCLKNMHQSHFLLYISTYPMPISALFPPPLWVNTTYLLKWSSSSGYYRTGRREKSSRHDTLYDTGVSVHKGLNNETYVMSYLSPFCSLGS